MSFLYPTFLWALTAVSIPVIIHLFNFRRYKKVAFTNVRFLQELKEETQSKQKLKHLLVLLLRCLAIICLVIAFAQPFFKKQQGPVAAGDNIVSVYVDNSFSMNAEGSEGELLEQARNKARDIARTYRGSDFFQLLTNDFEGRHQRLLSKEEFLSMVDEVKPSVQQHSFSEILNRQKECLSHARGNKQVFWLSDFQTNSVDLDRIGQDSTLNIHAYVLKPNEQHNLYIDSCWFESPYVALNENSKLMVRIHNVSDKDLENGSLTLKLNNTQKALSSFQVQRNSEAIVEMSFSTSNAGWTAGQLQIMDNPITFDDNLYFSFYVDAHIPVLAVNGGEKNKFISAVYTSNPYFELTQVSAKSINYDDLKNYKLIILNELETVSSGLLQQVKQYVDQGGTVLLVPGDERSKADAYNGLLQAFALNTYNGTDGSKYKVTEVNTQTEVFADVFEKLDGNMELPDVYKSFTIDNKVVTNRENLMKLGNGAPLLSVFHPGAGTVYLSAVPFQTTWSTLPQHALFVPFMYKMALLGNRQLPLNYVIGRDKVVRLKQQTKGREEVMVLKGNAGETVPELTSEQGRAALYIADLQQDGCYQLMQGRSDDSAIQVIAFNYNRNESPLKYFNDDALDKLFASGNITNLNAVSSVAEKAIAETQLRNSLWKWFVILTLLFLGTEVLVLRFLNPKPKLA